MKNILLTSAIIAIITATASTCSDDNIENPVPRTQTMSSMDDEENDILFQSTKTVCTHLASFFQGIGRIVNDEQSQALSVLVPILIVMYREL